VTPVERASAAILHDLRGRKLLKYLFAEDWEQRAAYGYVEEPIEGGVQLEIAQSLARAVLNAVIEPSNLMLRQGSDIGVESSDGEDYNGLEYPIGAGKAEEIWRSMVLAAIDEGPTGED
jgi:hypothetical protein